jgi:hypothetical protein
VLLERLQSRDGAFITPRGRVLARLRSGPKEDMNRLGASVRTKISCSAWRTQIRNRGPLQRLPPPTGSRKKNTAGCYRSPVGGGAAAIIRSIAAPRTLDCGHCQRPLRPHSSQRGWPRTSDTHRGNKYQHRGDRPKAEARVRQRTGLNVKYRD